MYKLNGEEPLSKEEAMRRREAVAARRAEREKAAACVAEALGTEVFATLMHISDPREQLIEAAYGNAR
jgi:hypothetical protein